MTDRYDIHGGAATEDPEAVGAPVNTGAPDTTLPPTHAAGEVPTNGAAVEPRESVVSSSSQSQTETRVPSPTFGTKGEHASHADALKKL